MAPHLKVITKQNNGVFKIILIYLVKNGGLKFVLAFIGLKAIKSSIKTLTLDCPRFLFAMPNRQ